jgi:hypothetical protein
MLLRADTTANEYMQELPESVQEMVGSVYLMLANAAEQNTALAICKKTQHSRSVEATLSC